MTDVSTTCARPSVTSEASHDLKTLQWTRWTQTDNYFTTTADELQGLRERPENRQLTVYNWRTNAATGRPLALVRPAETLTHWWLTEQTSDRKWWCQQSHCWTPLTNDHPIDWDSAKYMTYSTADYYQRLRRRAYYLNLEQTPLNRSQQLPAPYKRLSDELKQTW